MVRGWLRIVEATIAILIVVSSVLIVLQQEHQRTQSTLCGPVAPLLTEIAQTETLRSAVLAKDEPIIDTFLRTQITNPLLAYSFSFCTLDEVCTFTGQDVSKNSDVCADERLITPSLPTQNITKIKLFLYRAS